MFFFFDQVKLEIQDFFMIVKFLQYISSPFKRNSFVNGQSLLFNAMCIYYKIIIPDHQSFGFLKYFGSQYLWVDKTSPLLVYSSKLSGYEQFECEDRFYIISSNFVVKMISKHFKEMLNTLIYNYKKQFEFPKQKYLKECPFVVTVHTYICNKMQIGNKLSKFDCPFYMKVSTQEFFASFHLCFKKQFEIYLEQTYQFSLNLQDLDILQMNQFKNIYSALSIQYLMKAQGSSQIKQQVKQIRFAIQVNYLVEQNLTGIFKKIQILQSKFELNLQLNILRYLYEYCIFLVSNQEKLSFDSIENFNNAYSQYFNERFYIQDQKITRLIILFSIPFIEKDIMPKDNFKAEFYLTEQQKQLINLIFRDNIEIELKNFEKMLLNFENYFKIMFSHQNIDYELIEQICINARWQKLLDVIIQQSNSSKLSREIKEKINYLILKQKKSYQKYQKYQFQFTYVYNEENIRFDEFLKIQTTIQIDELNEMVESFKLQIKEVDRSVIQSPALALVIRSYYPTSNTFLSIIFNHQFLESFEMVLQIRIKLLQFMFRFADDSLKFRSALNTLVNLYKLEKQLLSDSIYSELDNQDQQYGQLHQDQIDNLKILNTQITELHKLIKDWEMRNISYQEANNQIDRDYQFDPTLIQRRRRQKFQIEVNNLQNN